MWIFTETGFVSAVRHEEDPDVMVVRARDRKSLAELENDSAIGIAHSPHNDYPYRVYVTESIFSEWLVKRVESARYTNFKSRVKDTLGYDYAHALMDVWTTMHIVEDEDARI